jgi:hypothetical protein
MRVVPTGLSALPAPLAPQRSYTGGAARSKAPLAAARRTLSRLNTFGGSFHCATADVRRRGGLQSYF